MNVTRKRTATNGCFEQPRRLEPGERVLAGAGFGGVCGRARLIAARTNDASPATRKMYALQVHRERRPPTEVPSAVPIQLTNPTSPIAGTAAQFTRMKMNGQLAAIQPMVPHTRTGPNSRAGSRRLRERDRVGDRDRRDVEDRVNEHKQEERPERRQDLPAPRRPVNIREAPSPVDPVISTG